MNRKLSPKTIPDDILTYLSDTSHTQIDRVRLAEKCRDEYGIKHADAVKLCGVRQTQYKKIQTLLRPENKDILQKVESGQLTVNRAVLTVKDLVGEKEIIRIGRNRIVDDGVNFHLDYVGTKSVRWTLDHDKRAIDYLVEDIKRNGVFLASGGRKGGANIKTVVMSAYRPYGYDPSDEVCLCDGNLHNLRSSNLYVYGDAIPYTQQRRIWHDGRRIWIKVAVQRLIGFTDYDPALYGILCNTALASWYVQTQKRNKGCVYRMHCRLKDYHAIGLGEIVWLFFAGKIDPVRVRESIIVAHEELTKSGLQIDHLRDNRANNCYHNLFAMPKETNASKNNLVTKINKPFYFVPVHVDALFRIECGRGYNSRRISCGSAEELLECVKCFYATAKASGDMLPSPDDPALTNCVSKMLRDDGREYDQSGEQNEIEAIIRADASSFTPWNGDFSWLV